MSEVVEKKGRRKRHFSGVSLKVLPVDPWSLKLKKARLRAQMSQRDLAAILGVSSVAISHWERGNSFPRKNKFEVIEAILGEKLFEVSPKIYAPGHAPGNIQLLLIYNDLNKSKKNELLRFAKHLQNQ